MLRMPLGRFIVVFLLLTSTAWADPGDIKWSFDDSGNMGVFYFTQCPAIDENGVLYFGSVNDLFYAVSPSGEKLWSRDLGDDVVPSAALSDGGVLFVGSDNNTMFAMNSADGSLVWTRQLSAALQSSAAIALDGKSVFFGGATQNVTAVRTSDGATLWEFATGAPVPSSPAIGEDGTVYVGSQSENLYALNPDTGARKWTTALGAKINSSPTLDKHGNLYVGTNGGTTAASTDSLWSVAPDGSTRWNHQTGDIVPASAVVGEDGTVSFISRDGYLYAMDPADGSVKWKYQVGGAGSTRTTPAIGADGTIFAMSSDGTLYAVDENGDLVWSTFLGAGVNAGSPSIASDGTVYALAGNGALYAVESGCGGLADTPWPKLRGNLRNTGKSVWGMLADPDQAPGVSVNMTGSTSRDRSASWLRSNHEGLVGFTPGTRTYGFNASVAPGSSNATFFFFTDGLSGTVSDYSLFKLKSDGSTVAYWNYAPGIGNRSEGSWWITDVTGNTWQNTSATLSQATTYRVYCTIMDNGEFDQNATSGGITDPLVLGKVDSGSSSTGCLVNPKAGLGPEMFLLLLGAPALWWIRRRG